MQASYVGVERRVHKVFVTRNTEYHIRNRYCVAVRDRKSGQWLQAHMALRSRIAGALRFTSEGGVLPAKGEPGIGDSLFMQAAGRDLLTSSVLSVERPQRGTVENYAA